MPHRSAVAAFTVPMAQAIQQAENGVNLQGKKCNFPPTSSPSSVTGEIQTSLFLNNTGAS
eukprot:5174204-Ditylum_brightwellii.AAC.1